MLRVCKSVWVCALIFMRIEISNSIIGKLWLTQDFKRLLYQRLLRLTWTSFNNKTVIVGQDWRSFVWYLHLQYNITILQYYVFNRLFIASVIGYTYLLSKSTLNLVYTQLQNHFWIYLHVISCYGRDNIFMATESPLQ